MGGALQEISRRPRGTRSPFSHTRPSELSSSNLPFGPRNERIASGIDDTTPACNHLPSAIKEINLRHKAPTRKLQAYTAWLKSQPRHAAPAPYRWLQATGCRQKPTDDVRNEAAAFAPNYALQSCISLPSDTNLAWSPPRGILGQNGTPSLGWCQTCYRLYHAASMRVFICALDCHTLPAELGGNGVDEVVTS